MGHSRQQTKQQGRAQQRAHRSHQQSWLVRWCNLCARCCADPTLFQPAKKAHTDRSTGTEGAELKSSQAPGSARPSTLQAGHAPRTWRESAGGTGSTTRTSLMNLPASELLLLLLHTRTRHRRYVHTQTRAPHDCISKRPCMAVVHTTTQSCGEMLQVAHLPCLRGHVP